VADKEQEVADELEVAGQELAELKQENKALTRGLESRDATITSLEQAVAKKDIEMETLRQSLADAESRLNETVSALAQAVASYKALVVESNPEMLPELVTGDTIDAVNESLGNARTLIDRVKQGMEEEASQTRVPAGAPQRSPLDLSSLSPREKIQYAVGGFSSGNR